ncbi:hypothetical protein PR003_g14208 [Phytophthora rubi]|uniref:Uncharacterized protein n=1 Tax=Phytophthora rubi TaxID=129364 RepID=A0A6A3LT23_9STRA|nr:hypothetical protein PR001_g13415 [Phytophthora rubi]KAE9333074.1 hypothetical protein PR003_g14208 [Phytophthora rubi]
MMVAFMSRTGADSDFSVSSTPTESVNSSAEHVNFVKEWTLTAPNTHDSNNDDDDDSDDDSSDDGDNKIDSIKLQLPGRVFVSYVNGLPSGVLGYVNVSGDSQTVVDAVKVRSNNDDEELEVKHDTNSSSASSGHLLTEIFLTTRSIVNDVKIESTAEVIIEDGVLVSSNTNKELQIKASDSSVVYVSSSAMSLQDLKLELSNRATLQLTTDSISIREDGQFQAHDKSRITVLTSSLKAGKLDLDTDNSGTICISAEEVTASSYDGEEASKISLPNASTKYTSTGTLSCDEVSVPSREPSCISSSACTSSTTSTSSTSTSAPSTSTATSSSSGVKTSEQTSAAVASFSIHIASMTLLAGLLAVIVCM